MKFSIPLLAFLLGCSLSLQPAAAASLKSCVNGIKRAAMKAGISRTITNRAFKGIVRDKKVIRFSRLQPEFKTPIWDYMAFLVDRERVDTGRKMLKKHARTFRAIEKSYGVDRYVLAALWGVESDFGNLKGDFFLPHALANVICFGRRGGYFRKELIRALKIVSRGDIRLRDLKSSWAGAFGQTQFMPSTYQRLAVDFDRDGRRDLVHSIPDALASSANFLKKAGWRRGRVWGYEVSIPKNYRGRSGRRKKARLSDWGRRGIKRKDGRRIKGKMKAALILPAGRRGPAFLTTRNFDALYSYNAAVSYALAISHLSDRLRGRKGFKTPWPTNDLGLSRIERRELKKRLKAKGYRITSIDWRIDPVAKTAIRQVQKKLGMKPTGRASQRILKSLR